MFVYISIRGRGGERKEHPTHTRIHTYIYTYIYIYIHTNSLKRGIVLKRVKTVTATAAIASERSVYEKQTEGDKDIWIETETSRQHLETISQSSKV